MQPGETSAQPVRRWLALAYLAAALLPLALGWTLAGFDQVGLDTPRLHSGDVLAPAIGFRAILEQPWFMHIARLGAPNQLELYDFPTIDNLQLALFWPLRYLIDDWVVLYNLAYLIGFSLIGLSSFAVLRALRMGPAPALAAATLFACLPKRFSIGQSHFSLTQFWQVPLAVLVLVWLCDGDRPLWQPGQTWRQTLRERRLWVALAACALVAVNSPYYTYFFGLLLIMLGIWSAAEHRRWSPLGIALALAAWTGAVFAVQLWPSLAYWVEHGSNQVAALRNPGEAELYGIKLIQLLLPVEWHRAPALHLVAHHYALNAPLVNENQATALGAVGSVGLLGLLARAVVRRHTRVTPALTLAMVVLASLLLASVGGLGAAINRWILPTFRVYARVSVFVAFASLAAIALAIHRLEQRRRWLPWVVAPCVLAFGIWDQTVPVDAAALDATRGKLRAMRTYVAQVEAKLPEGAQVLQLPYAQFPEQGKLVQMHDYEHLRPWLLGRHLRWSYPAIKGRVEAEWAKRVSKLPAVAMLAQLHDSGFSGIWLDRRGYADRGAEIEVQLNALLRQKPLVSSTGDIAFFTLPPPSTDPNVLDLAQHPLVLHVRSGCYGAEHEASQGEFYWCRAAGQLELANDAKVTRQARLLLAVQASAQPCPWRLSGPVLEHPLEQPRGQGSIDVPVTLPPGRHVLRFTANCPVEPLVNDSRQLVWRMRQPRLQELPQIVR
ncbi:MAG: hypothetical protein HY902_16150 [Deltaproteobacteria bacterium]|nr:hypothetical protein [Deltaproteobacteria bacterium]